jgi:hypothetical protein
MGALAWFYSLPGLHAEAPASVRQPAARPRTTVVERWNGTQWIEVVLAWDGEQYAEVK